MPARVPAHIGPRGASGARRRAAPPLGGARRLAAERGRQGVVGGPTGELAQGDSKKQMMGERRKIKIRERFLKGAHFIYFRQEPIFLFLN